MSNITYKNALIRLINIFKNDFLSFSREQFTSSGSLTHPGEFGTTRENVCRNFLRSVIPSSKEIKTKGFILNSNNQRTTEQDLIIYSERDTPILTLESTSFFPIETVVAIGQVKSVIQTKNELKSILNNLVEVKKLRNNMGHTSVIWRSNDLWNGRDGYYPDNAFDQVFTFVICEKLNFIITPGEIDELYDKNIEDYLKHNMILDINNGLYGYQVKPQDPFVAFPCAKEMKKNNPIHIGTINESHFKHFLTNIHIHTSSNTIFHPDMGRYIV